MTRLVRCARLGHPGLGGQGRGGGRPLGSAASFGPLSPGSWSLGVAGLVPVLRASAPRSSCCPVSCQAWVASLVLLWGWWLDVPLALEISLGRLGVEIGGTVLVCGSPAVGLSGVVRGSGDSMGAGFPGLTVHGLVGRYARLVSVGEIWRGRSGGGDLGHAVSEWPSWASWLGLVLGLVGGLMRNLVMGISLVACWVSCTHVHGQLSVGSPAGVESCSIRASGGRWSSRRWAEGRVGIFGDPARRGLLLAVD